MFENYLLNDMPNKLTGYQWDLENPTKIMCIIHGLAEHAGRYDRMAKILNDAGIAVFSVDLPGHGLSYGKRGDAAPRDEVFIAVDKMLDYARKKHPNVPIILYGHSMGGNVCMDYRMRGGLNLLPEKYIVSAPWLRVVRSVPKPMFIALKALAKVTPKATMSSGCNTEDLGNMDIVYDYSSDPLVHGKITLRAAVECFEIGEAIARGLYPSDGLADEKPLLLMHGSDDKICSVEGSRMVAARYEGKPWFKYVEWPGYYHEIHNGGPEATGEDVISAIRDYVLS